jgi:hypothetical protein
MSIVNTVKTIVPHFGTPTEYVSLVAQNVPINASTSFVLTGFVNFVRSGRIRFKTTATGGAASQITGIKITGTDGTNTVTLYQDTTARTANEFEDFLYSFISELNLTTVTVIVTTANAGGAATADLEIAGNS